MTAIWNRCSRTIANRCATWQRRVLIASVTTSCRCWTGPALSSRLGCQQGGTALRFNAHEHAAFDCFMLRRPGAEGEHSPEVLARARVWFDAASEAEKDRLLATIMAGLPGAYQRYDVPSLRRVLDAYKGITRDDLRARLADFLRAVIPTAAELGVRLCIHPDDPPRPLFGLPRIVSNEDDIAFLLDAVDTHENGLTLCTGSLGAGAANDLPAIARRFASRTHFVHLRNVTKEPDGSFQEAAHLGGDVDMVAVVRRAAGGAGAAQGPRRCGLADAVPARPWARTA